MLKQYRFKLNKEAGTRVDRETAYDLYAFLLSLAPQSFAAEAHSGSMTPLSQYLEIDGGLCWVVNLIGKRGIGSLSDKLESLDEIHLKHNQLEFSVAEKTLQSIDDLETLLALGDKNSGIHSIDFRSPAAFKSGGKYVNMPSARLIVRNLIKRWNDCLPEALIEDEDGQGIDAITDGLAIESFSIKSATYNIKGNLIPSFTGSLEIKNNLSGFQRRLANSLLIFSEYSGIGIKTSLGLGGIRHTSIPAGERQAEK